MRLLGISAFYHDSAAVLLQDGGVVAAAQEERFRRQKHYSGFPDRAIDYCLEHCGGADALDAVVFYEKPLRKFDRLVRMHLARAPDGLESFAASVPIWLREKLFQGAEVGRRVLGAEGTAGWKGELLFAEHHQSHAASAFFPSPFERAIVLTMDGVGEWTTTSVARGEGNRLTPLKQIRFPHSLGLLYSAFTAYLGFRINSGEYKVMGLAPYGQPRYRQRILEELVDLKADGSFRLNQRYFAYTTALAMTNERFDQLFEGPARVPEGPLRQRDMDLAASVQAVVEEVVLAIARHLAREYPEKHLCLAGGVALNCVANGKILREGLFEKIWVQPAAGDAGGALGAALSAYHSHYGGERTVRASDAMQGSYLGPRFSNDEAKRRLEAAGAVLQVESEQELLDRVATALDSGLAVGWFNGRMEYGPRALGARSILADPRRADMQRKLNLKIKFRESFRPFAPAVLAEHAAEWFDIDTESPYMLLVAPVHEARRRPVVEDESAVGLEQLQTVRSAVPAVTHVDYSARVQTVHRETNARFHALLSRFHEKTGCPILINTSFNVRGEPIVCTPEDAFRCFMGTNLDLLVVEDCVMEKKDQDEALGVSYRDKFALD